MDLSGVVKAPASYSIGSIIHVYCVGDRDNAFVKITPQFPKTYHCFCGKLEATNAGVAIKLRRSSSFDLPIGVGCTRLLLCKSDRSSTMLADRISSAPR
jgi:hypothetical protein